MWNRDLQDVSSTAASARHRKGQKATGRADHFFNSGYFVVPQLHAMACGELPLPIPHIEAAAGAQPPCPTCPKSIETSRFIENTVAVVQWQYPLL